ncbi:hypothetical protein DL93DRAFT_914715 [Clavulina sp. PMI_390]|nr:hypothetical protein DL93DRAFT_914715 [Clavulina sp. PMI_390]
MLTSLSPNIRTKEYLARQAREAEQGSTSSPPLTPLSQVHYLSDEDDVHDEQSFASQQETFMQEANVSSAIVSKPASLPQENPLDRLFAGLTEPPLGSRSTLTSTAQPLVDGIPQNHPLLPAFVSHTPEIQASTATTTPGFSLLDQLFASAANEVVEPNTKASLIATTVTAAAVSRTIDAPSTPPQTHQNTAAVAQSIAPIYDSRHASDDEIIVVPQTRGRLSSTSRAAPAPDAEEYQELEPPSPSKIPNPLHTPAVHLSSRQKQRRRRGPSRPRRGPAHQAIDLDHEDLPALPPIRGSSRPPQPKQHYIPDNTKEESKLDKEAIATSLLNAHVERMTHDGAPYPTLPKYEFVSEILTLIHVSL